MAVVTLNLKQKNLKFSFTEFILGFSFLVFKVLNLYICTIWMVIYHAKSFLYSIDYKKYESVTFDSL